MYVDGPLRVKEINWAVVINYQIPVIKLIYKIPVQLSWISFLFFKYKNFHFSDGKVLSPCKKVGIILTGWTLVCVVQAYIAVAGVWCIGNTKIRTTSKYWPVATVAQDSIAFLPSYQRQLCWWQTTLVDKAEQEWVWCFSVNSRALKKQKVLVNT